MPIAFQGQKGEDHDDQLSDIINYIRHMLAEIRTIAASQKQEMLVYLIEMAAVEAGDIVARHRVGSHGEIEGNQPARVAVKTSRKV